MLHFSSRIASLRDSLRRKHVRSLRSSRPAGASAVAMAVGHAAFEALEDRRLMAADTLTIRTFDGTSNNLVRTAWGSTEQPFIRLAATSYADGKSTPVTGRPSARAISNAVADQTEEMLNDRDTSAFIYAWGQFLDHDLDLSATASPAESFPISVPTGDPYFDPAATGTKTIPLSRTEFVVINGVRQQVNSVTAYIDASMVYGSDKARADALRTMSGGKLRTSDGNLLPYNTTGLPNDSLGGPASSLFVAGDVRANENVELLALQTLFVREHNRLATQIAAQNRRLNDEQIYQQARRLVIGEIQSITYNEFLPALLGDGALRPYTGYKPGVNAGISNEFTTAAYRLGHSMLADDVEFLDNNGEDVRPDIELAEGFFNPALFKSTGADPILKYLATSNSQEIDTHIVGSLRNFLFGPPGAGGLDLASLNIQRGRDHGLADYNTTRAAVGLPKVDSFDDITSDVALQSALQSVYGSVNSIDLWVGGLAEDHVRGSSVGPTFQRIIADQFTRSRDGDRFFYLRDLTGADLRAVAGTSLSDVIKANSTITNIQDNAFIFSVEVRGLLFADRNGDGRVQPGERGIAGRTVSLTTEDGEVLTTTTDREGRYEFSAVPLGDNVISTDLPNTTTPATRTIVVTKGELFSRVDFGTRPPRVTPPNLPPPNAFAARNAPPASQPTGPGVIDRQGQGAPGRDVLALT